MTRGLELPAGLVVQVIGVGLATRFFVVCVIRLGCAQNVSTAARKRFLM